MSTADRVSATRTALITGAAGDIGSAVAARLAQRGENLVLTDHPSVREGLDEVEDRCRRLAPQAVIATVTFDVTDAEAVSATLTELAGATGPADLLFNNAGYQGEFSNTVDASLDDFAQVLDVNVRGVFIVLQAFAGLLRDAGRPGAVVNAASMAGLSGAPNMAGYSASKAAVLGLTKSAAKDLAPLGIRVNAVSPGFIGPGAMWDNQVRRQADVSSIYYGDADDVVAAQMINQIPLRRYGSLDEVASTVCFLLSDEASYLTGVNLEVSGGAA